MGRKKSTKRRNAKDQEEDQADGKQAKEATAVQEDAGRDESQAPQHESAGAGEEPTTHPEDEAGHEANDKPARSKRKRRRRKPRKSAKSTDVEQNEEDRAEDAPEESPAEPHESKDEESSTQEASEDTTRKKKRRGRRGSRSSRKRKSKSEKPEAPAEKEASRDEQAEASEDAPDEPGAEEADEYSKGKRRRRGRGKKQVKAVATEKIGKGREMLINVIPGEECRIAVTLEGRLEELFIERASSQSNVGNIYKGRVTNVEPSIQAAFVDFGNHKNGFLHISDLVPQYFPDHDGQPEDIGRKTPRKDRPPIQGCLRRGQEVIVQITKEGIGTKGPTLSTYISVPGRFLVMMPGMNRLGVSRKIEEDEERRKMREMLNQLDIPRGMGFILRTAGLNRTKRELQRDLNYLMRLWKTVTKKIKNEKAPASLYEESDLAIRTVRDTLESDIERIVVDDESTAEKIREFLSIAMPRSLDKIRVYDENAPLFYRFGIEEEIEKLHSRYVPLPSGGSLVIEPTEALVAIDVNSGKYREQADAEETARRTDLEAADEIARQLRLRDLGGLIICDFIDLRLDKNKRQVERALRDALKRHKERAKILRMSRFGIIEMTRQRTRPSISRSMHQDCPCCGGTGMIKTQESMILEAMRLLQLAAHRENVDRIEVRVRPRVAFELLNRRRRSISDLEQRTGKTIHVKADDQLGSNEIELVCADARGRPVKFP